MAEIVAYLLMVTFGLFSCFVRVKSRLLFFTSSFFVFFIYCILVRTAEFSIDIVEYANAMARSSMSFYYLREPVFWLGSRVLYDFTGSASIVFLIYDALAFWCVCLAISKKKLPLYFLFLWFCFFASVMGMQNVYRQFLAANFFLLMLAYSGRYRLIFFALSVLSHNVAALFVPLLFEGKKFTARVFYPLSALVLVALPFAAGTKSHSSTGDVGFVFFLFALLLVFFAFLFVKGFVLRPSDREHLSFFVFFVSLSLSAAVFLGEAQAKRVTMMCLLLSLVPLCFAIEKLKLSRLHYRISFFLIAFSPTLIFPSARNFLLNQI